MSKLKIRNFGPIINGMHDEWIDFSKVTVFIGNQGTGKSTIVKLLASFGWLEKKILRGYVTIEELLASEKEQEYSLERRLEYFNLLSYLRDNSYIEYKSSYFHFVIKDKRYKIINPVDNNSEIFLTTKISYIPAERNFITAIESSARMTQLPHLLSRFQAEYRTGLEELASKKCIDLHVDNLSVKYDNQSTLVTDSNSKFEIKIHEASSGIQSLTPLLIHTLYNITHIRKNINNFSELDLEYFRADQYNYSVESEAIIKKNINSRSISLKQNLEKGNESLSVLIPILEQVINLPSEKLSRKTIKIIMNDILGDVTPKILSKDELKDLDIRGQLSKILDKLKTLFDESNKEYQIWAKRSEQLEICKFLDFTFTNIIEELEQNLYPESLKNILCLLLSQINSIAGTPTIEQEQNTSIDAENNQNISNLAEGDKPEIRCEQSKLILTTHSPFTISYLTLIAKAGNVLEEIKKTNTNEEEINEAIEQINKIVPVDALVTGDNMKIYHLQDGSVTLLENHNSMPSDENLLNVEMRKFNNDYRKLVQVKKSYYIEPEELN